MVIGSLGIFLALEYPGHHIEAIWSFKVEFTLPNWVFCQSVFSGFVYRDFLLELQTPNVF